MNDSARQRSDEFLRIADQFKLGDLVTETSHPVTAKLSEVAQEDVAAALQLLFKVDEDVVLKYREVVESGRMIRIADEVSKALQAGGRVFFTGCGSTGRLSILLDSIWREFWQQTRDQPGRGAQSVEDWEHRTFSVMAGGDFALIKAVEGFEDYTAFGRKQIRDLGVRAGDVVFAITEGGETSFVIGTAWEGVDAGAKVYFVYNNPDDILCRCVERSREIIADPRIEKLNLTTGPMAISGSTRMQATTIQLCVLVTVLEIVVQRLHGAASDTHEDVPGRFLQGLETLHHSLLSDGVLEALASLVNAEVNAYQSGGRVNYHADQFAIDVLTDTTERSPTFCTPPFRKSGDRSASESLAFLFVSGRATPEAWRWVLKRPARCLEWSRVDVKAFVPAGKLERTVEILEGITERELIRFGIGAEGMTDRPLREGDLALEIASGMSNSTPADDVQRQGGTRGLASQRVALLFAGQVKPNASAAAAMVHVPVPSTGFLIDGLTRVAVKVVLNAFSTCVMVRLGRVMGNTMIYVVPSNLKLIDRATRYICRLAGLNYGQANRLLFEAIEYVEPRMLNGMDYPPVVGLVVLHARKGVSLVEAEQLLEKTADLGR